MTESPPSPSLMELAARTVANRQDKAKTYAAGITENGLALCVDLTDRHYVFDTLGRTFLDLTSGGGALPMGSHHLIREAIWDNKALNFPYAGPYGASCQALQVNYAEALSNKFPKVAGEPQQVFFTASSTEAMLIATQMAQQFGTAYINIKPIDAGSYEPLDTGQAQRLCNMEVDAPGGRAIIIDERITGFGRLGSFRTAWTYGLEPHAERIITVFGEAGGGGIPFGAIVAPRRFFGPGVPWLAPRHGGSPLACAAGLAILGMQNDMFYEHVRDLSRDFEVDCERLRSQFPEIVLSYHGRGMARALRINDHVSMELLSQALLNNGVIATISGDRLLLTPPLIMTSVALDEAFNQIAAALIDVGKIQAAPATAKS